MNIRRLLLSLLVCAGMMAGLASCSDEEDCQTTRAMLILKVVQERDGKLISDTIPFLTVKVQETDSVIINRDENVTSFTLPLSYEKERSQFVLDYLDGTTEQLTIEHLNTPFFVSPDCGFQMNQEVQSIQSSGTLIRSSEIINPTIPSTDEEHIRIYLK